MLELPLHAPAKPERLTSLVPWAIGCGCIVGLVLTAGCSSGAEGTGRVGAESGVTTHLAGPDGGTDHVSLALWASGYETQASLETAKADLERYLKSVLESVGEVAPANSSAADARDRGAKLLAALHAPSGYLQTYDARATTLMDVLGSRKFNCVSASVLYNLLAERAGLQVAAELLPTHARSLLLTRDGPGVSRVVVETTSPTGFDPPEDVALALPARRPEARRNDAIFVADDAGAIVDTQVLIGTIFVNRASIAQEAGEFERAETLFARGEALASEPAMKQVLRDQRAALLSQLAADDISSGGVDRWKRALRTLRAAIALAPSAARIRSALHQNLRAALERLIADAATHQDEAAVLSLVDGASSAGMPAVDLSALRAFALSEVARIKADARDFEGALASLASALSVPLSPADERLRRTLHANRTSVVRMAAIDAGQKGDLASAWSYLDRLTMLSGASAEDRAHVEEDRKAVVDMVAKKMLDDEAVERAADAYRAGLRRFPSVDRFRSNLVAVLERQAVSKARGPDCLMADPLLDEIRVYDPKSPFPSQLRAQCLTDRAKERFEAGDLDEALRLMLVARKDVPSDPAVAKGLAVVLLKVADELSGKVSRRSSSGAQCRKILGLVRDAQRLDPTLSESTVRHALGSCRIAPLDRSRRVRKRADR